MDLNHISYHLKKKRDLYKNPSFSESDSRIFFENTHIFSNKLKEVKKQNVSPQLIL